MKKKSNKTRILIHVEGGLISNIVADKDIEVIVYDYDVIKDDVQCAPGGARDAECVEVGVGKYKNELAKHERFVSAERKHQGSEAISSVDSETGGVEDGD